MLYNSMTLLGLAASAYAAPQLIERESPKGSAPDGCETSYDGKFQVSIYKLAAKRSVESRADGEGILELTLEDGVLKDSQDRIGYVASNYQFQFDGPVQDGALYDSGFSVCGNGSLALGPSTVFYQCLSGDFYNLYDRHWAAQCEPVEIVAAGASSGGGADVTQIPDGQVVGSSLVATQVVTVIGDGQPQVHTTTIAVPLCQIGDGQVQGVTTPCGELPPVTQISDGQIQVPPSAPPAPPVTQISDGQVQAPTDTAVAPPVTQISDGQIQAPTDTVVAPPITQISDGQIQAPTATAPVVTQISDGQIQAPTGAPNATVPAAPTNTVVPPSSGSKMIPGTAGALLVAFLGAVMYL